MGKKVIIYIIMALFILGLVYLALYPGTMRAWKDSGKSGGEKCKVPQGYTEQEWKEHMGHHPDIYRECL